MKGLVLHYRDISVDYTNFPHIIIPNNATNFTSYGLNSSSLYNTSSILSTTSFANFTILNSTTLADLSPHVGSLPVTKFIYALTGGLVFLLCIPSIIAFVDLLFKTLRNKLKNQEVEQGGQRPKFLEKHARPRPVFHTILDATIKDQPDYDSSTSTRSSFRPNFPLSVEIPASEEDQTRPTTVTLDDIVSFQQIVREKGQLDRAIVNLKRLDGGQKATGAGSGATRKISEMMYKRAQLMGSINTALERFRTLRESLSDEEWAAIEQIKRLL
jgi:hypothetical protein